MEADELTRDELAALCGSEGLLPRIRYREDAAFPWQVVVLFTAVTAILLWETLRLAAAGVANACRFFYYRRRRPPNKAESQQQQQQRTNRPSTGHAPAPMQ
jgi:hypothetical protein